MIKTLIAGYHDVIFKQFEVIDQFITSQFQADAGTMVIVSH